MPETPQIAIIGAGIGGLASALRLAHAGCGVTVFETHAGPGGKMRTLPSAAGPVDAGPTVLTLRPVFEDLFAYVGETLTDHLKLHAETTLARHYWSDGTALDLCTDPRQSHANISATFGAKAAREFDAFSARARRLFEAFDAPMMRAPAPSKAALALAVLRQPRLIPDMAPWHSLARSLRSQFSEPKLAQLFGRYATYVGGSPLTSPALLGLIWHAEARGVWRVEGGMHRLATAIESLARRKGAIFQYNCPVSAITPNADGWSVRSSDGQRQFDAVLFNGDAAAIADGLLGMDLRGAVPRQATDPGSLSAAVHAFAATPHGMDLAHHTVFFGDDPESEFRALANGRLPDDPTLYVCAQDRGAARTPNGPERFEIIMNAPSLSHYTPKPDEAETCQRITFDRLKRMGLTFDPGPGPETLTTPAGFHSLFPGSKGALYGRSPQGLMAAFARPQARTNLPGFYLVGGSAHPGAGVPMATLSARHAAEAITTDLISHLPSLPTVTPGGTSTASATTTAARSRLSAS